MSRYYSGWAPYVPVAKRRAQAAKKISQLFKNGETPQPVSISGTKIATTFWGKAWCDNLESYSDLSNRLPRGKTYARNGSVIHLEIKEGKVIAMVQGSSLYHVSIQIKPLAATRWENLKKQGMGKITNLLDLIQGKLPKELLALFCDKEAGLFPAPREIETSCSCPDYAGICKHLAAVFYGIGNRLDHEPDLFFTLRSLDASELLAAAGSMAGGLDQPQQSEIAADDLADIFGVEMDSSAPVFVKPKVVVPPKTKQKPAAAQPVKKVANKKKTPIPRKPDLSLSEIEAAIKKTLSEINKLAATVATKSGVPTKPIKAARGKAVKKSAR